MTSFSVKPSKKRWWLVKVLKTSEIWNRGKNTLQTVFFFFSKVISSFNGREIEEVNIGIAITLKIKYYITGNGYILVQQVGTTWLHVGPTCSTNMLVQHSVFNLWAFKQKKKKTKKKKKKKRRENAKEVKKVFLKLAIKYFVIWNLNILIF